MTDALAAHDDRTLGGRRVRLAITGMSCGACAARIEKRLNKIDGVRAFVDFPSRIATIDVAADIAVAELCSIVRDAGYGADHRPEGSADAEGDAPVPSAGLAGLLMGAVATGMRWMHRL